MAHNKPKYGTNALGLQRVLSFGSYHTAWKWLHRLRRAMVRPDRDKLYGTIEVDETYIGGERSAYLEETGMSINYDNFKDQIAQDDHDRADIYLKVWDTMQKAFEGERPD